MASRWVCAERYLSDTGEIMTGDVVDGSPFCSSCDLGIRSAIADLRMTRLELDVLYGRTYSGFSSDTHAAIPIHEEVDALARRLDRAVLDWSDAVAYEQNLSCTYNYREAARRLEAHYDALLDVEEWTVIRWVDERQVPRLSPHTTGLVKASGEARIAVTMSGPEGALELQRIHATADRLISRL